MPALATIRGSVLQHVGHDGPVRRRAPKPAIAPLPRSQMISFGSSARISRKPIIVRLGSAWLLLAGCRREHPGGKRVVDDLREIHLTLAS